MQGWVNDLNMLLSCFRTKMSGSPPDGFGWFLPLFRRYLAQCQVSCDLQVGKDLSFLMEGAFLSPVL